MLVQSGHDLLEDRETDLLAVEVEPLPAAHEGAGSPRRITLGRPAARPSAVMNWSTVPGVRPSQPPNQSPVQPMIDTTQRGSSPSRPPSALDPGRHAPRRR